jgi:hypothetical protein
MASANAGVKFKSVHWFRTRKAIFGAVADEGIGTERDFATAPEKGQNESI